jgi:hypothetical protein
MKKAENENDRVIPNCIRSDDFAATPKGTTLSFAPAGTLYDDLSGGGGGKP